jgi:hypothetical protein
LRKDVPHGAGGGLKSIAWRGGAEGVRIVEQQMTLIERSLVPENCTGPHPYWRKSPEVFSKVVEIAGTSVRVAI